MSTVTGCIKCPFDPHFPGQGILTWESRTESSSPLEGQLNTLDAYVWNASGPVGIKEYYIKVVPVTYTNVHGVQLSSNQYVVRFYCTFFVMFA